MANLGLGALWSEVYQHASRIISTFTGENFKNIINADMLIG